MTQIVQVQFQAILTNARERIRTRMFEMSSNKTARTSPPASSAAGCDIGVTSMNFVEKKNSKNESNYRKCETDIGWLQRHPLCIHHYLLLLNER
jgi:hypothetical protein